MEENYRSVRLSKSPQEVGFFYPVPSALWNLLKREIPAFDGRAEMLIEEYESAKKCGDFASTVGSHNGIPLQYNLLVTPETYAQQLKDRLKEMKGHPDWKEISPAKFALSMAVADKRTIWFNRTRRAYCGWLLTNPRFLREHNALCREHSDVIMAFGTRFISRPHADQTTTLAPTINLKRMKSLFASDLRTFCKRWHLGGLAGPYLPIPLGVYAPVINLRHIPPDMRENGVMIYFPFTAALPSESELRDLISDTQKARMKVDHIAAWLQIVSTKTTNKGKQLDRLSRIFTLQHFLRSLRERFPEQIKRKKGALLNTFASYFRHNNSDSIKDDFRLVDRSIRQSRP